MEIITSSPISVTFLAFLFFATPGVLARSRSSFDFQDLPKFLPSDDNFSYRAGQVAVLDCRITNLGKKKVIWRRASDATPLTVGYMSFNEDPRYAVEHPKGTDKWNLIIREVKTSDAGVYECQVSSRMRHLRHHVTLKVLDPLPPPAAKPKIEIAGSNFIDEGGRIFLKCNATNKEYPPQDIDWFRSGNALSTRPANGMFIRKDVSISTGSIVSSMEIKHAKLSDQGTYVCRTSNRDVTSIHIHILKADSNQTKRNTEKRVDDDAAYASGTGVHGGVHKGGDGYYGGQGQGQVRQGSRGNQAGRGGQGGGEGGQESLRCNHVLLLVLPIMTSVITYLFTTIREVT